MNNLYSLTLFDFFHKNTLLNKEATAIHWKGGDTSFQALYTQTCQLTAGLSELNLPKNARVAVLAKNHPVFFIFSERLRP